MSNWSTEPATTQAWVDFITSIQARDVSVAKMDFAGDTNVPSGAIRWNRSTLAFEEYNGSVWTALTNLVKLNVANVFTASPQRVRVASNGYVDIVSGDSSFPGSIDFYTPDGVRRLRIGNMGTAGITFSQENGYAINFTGGAPKVGGVSLATVNQVLGLTSLADPNVDRILFWDESIAGGGSLQWLSLGPGLSITGTTLGFDESGIGTETNTASRVVRRNASGQIFAQYYNQESPNSENPAISQVLVTNGSDNYLRKASLSHVLAQGGVWTTTNLPSSSLVFTGGDQTIAGVKTFSSVPQFSAQGAFPHFGGSGNVSGKITVSTADPSGTPGAGDIWIKYTP